MTSTETVEIANLRHGIRAIELNVDAVQMRNFTPKPREKKALENIKSLCRSLLRGGPVCADDCLIWSNEHMRWWGPNECGYVNRIDEAGRYSYDRAIQIVHNAQAGRQNMRDHVPPEIVVREADAFATLDW